MHQTAISNPYFMEAPPKERTEINFIAGEDLVHCYGCGREVLPKIIKSAFIGHRRGLAVCPSCNTVVQDPPAKPIEPKKQKKQRTVFVWQCEDCSAQYAEDQKLPLAISAKDQTCRVCSECFGEVHLVEK